MALFRNRRLRHRRHVGGRWDEIGRLQLDFLVGQGLRPDDDLLDVGCGSLRAGVRLVDYLSGGRYYGLDIDDRLLAAGRRELEVLGLNGRNPVLLRDDAFRFTRFGRTFRWAVAQSVFTHLPFNTIMRCLGEMERVLAPGGRFYATFFENPGPRLGTEEVEEPDDVVTFLDRDPYFYDPSVFEWAVAESSLSCAVLGDWGHPRNQKMLLFTKRDEAARA